ncbi:MAG: urease accessory protein UreF [Rhodospirillaceae bacterium]|nr:urease accessory protein UreF [Rhodospirillaceae bacterium]
MATSMAPAASMTDPALYRLMAWLSPAYPVGAFSYSHGLEWLVESGAVRNAATLAAWLEDVLAFGAGRNDAIFFCAAYRAAGDSTKLRDIAELAAAFAPAAERRLETCAQGSAFSAVTRKTWRSPALEQLDAGDESLPYPVAVATAAADHGIDLTTALHAYLQAFGANLVSAGVRLIPLGHTDGQIVLTRLEGPVARAAEAALPHTLDDLGGAAVLTDIAAMKHETQYTRLFRS